MVSGPAVLRKVAYRLVPLMALVYFINYLDRVNVGFAALTMNEDLAFSASVYGHGAGVFFLGYVLFQIPSNIALEKWGANRWFGPIMIAWGTAASCMAFVGTPLSLYVTRFLLGIAESGFFPGMMLYMTYWFPAEARGKVMSAFLMAAPVSSVVGAPISTAMLGLEGWGLKGWQWMFVLQGLPAVLLGFVVMRVLTPKPADATWLEPAEKAWLIAALDAENASSQRTGNFKYRDALLNTKVWAFALVYFAVVIGFYGLGLWLPQIIKGFGGLTTMQIGLLTTIPYALAALAMYLWGAHSDTTGERKYHAALPMLLAAIGLAIGGTLIDAPVLAFTGMSIAAVGIFSSFPTFWTLVTASLGSAAAAVGIALINLVGNLGGYAGPAVIGYFKDSTGSYTAGFIVLSAFAVLAGTLTIYIARPVIASRAAATK